MKQHLSTLDPEILLLGGFEIHSYSSPITSFMRELVAKRHFIGLPWAVECHLLLAEMLYDIEMLVKPALSSGQTVLYDSYLDSIIAFQSARALMHMPAQSDSAIAYLKQVMQMSIDAARTPTADCTIYVMCESDRAKTRMEQRDGMPVTAADLALEVAIARQYNILFSGRDVLVVDNTRDEDWAENVQRVVDYIRRNVMP